MNSQHYALSFLGSVGKTKDPDISLLVFLSVNSIPSSGVATVEQVAQPLQGGVAKGTKHSLGR